MQEITPQVEVILAEKIACVHMMAILYGVVLASSGSLAGPKMDTLRKSLVQKFEHWGRIRFLEFGVKFPSFVRKCLRTPPPPLRGF